MILWGGSATDLPEQTPQFASMFNTVDSFDTHAKIPEFYQSVNEAAIKNNTTAIISVGWDPGLFSINRVMAEAILPNGENYTFWGKGLSQGHSDAVRRVTELKMAFNIRFQRKMQWIKYGAVKSRINNSGKTCSRMLYRRGRRRRQSGNRKRN